MSENNHVYNICINCGDYANEQHFIVPLQNGGNKYSTNLVWLCSACKDLIYKDINIIDKQTCINCGRHADNRHHVVPRSLGGNNTTNCVWLCDECHSLVHGISNTDGILSHSELIKIGMQRAREEGKVIGRAKTTSADIEWFKPYMERIKQGETISKIAKEADISRPTVYKYIELLNN